MIAKLLQIIPLLFAAFAMVRSFKRPAWLIVAIFATVCFPVAIAAAITPYKIALLLAFARVVALVAQRRVVLPVSPLILVFIGVELLFTLATLSWREGSFYNINWILGALLCYLVVSQAVEKTEELREIGAGMVVILVLMVAATTLEYRDVSRSQLVIIRATGPVGDPNATAATAVATTFFALPWLLARPLSSRPFWLGGTLLALIWQIFMTNSRGVTIGLIASVGAAMWLLSRGTAQRLRNILLAGAVLVTAWAFAPSSYETRMTETLRSDASGQVVVDDTGRSQLNRIGLEMIAEEPIFGHGPRAFPRRAERIVGYAFVLHNAWLGAMVEVGVPIGLLYLVAHLLPLGWMWRASMQLSELDRPVVASILGASTLMLLFYATNPSRFEPMDYLTIGLAAKVAAIARRQRRPVARTSGGLVGGLAVDRRPA